MTKKMFEPFDQEEKELMESLENDEWISVPPKELKEMKDLLQQAVKNTRELRKQINIRLNPSDVLALKEKSSKLGMPYQTLINTLIHQYVTGKITLTL